MHVFLSLTIQVWLVRRSGLAILRGKERGFMECWHLVGLEMQYM